MGSLTSLPTQRPYRLRKPVDALIYALDVLVPQLAAATDDNPATPVTDLSKAA